MPYIEIITNIEIAKSKAEEIKTEIASAMASNFTGKTENWLMVDFSDKKTMYFSGKDAPCAMVKVALFGKGTDKAFDKMTADTCGLIEKALGIPGDRVYVKYEESTRWGWNGTNF